MLGLRVATQAVTLVLLTRLLGPSKYGSFTAAASLAIVIGTLPNLGAGYVLLSRATRDPSATADVWRYTWPLTLLLGLLLLAVYLISGRALISQAALPLDILLWVGATELLLTPYIMLFSFALQSRERVPLSQLVQWIPLGLRLIAAALCFYLNDGVRLLAFATSQFAASFLGALVGWRITIGYVQLNWHPRLATRQELMNGASYAAMSLVTSNPSEVDKIVAVRTVGSFEAGIYTASSRVMIALVMPVVAMLLAAQPRLFRDAGDGSVQNRRLISVIALLAAGWGLLSSLLLALCSPLLPVLFGPAYAGTAKLVPWLALIPPLLSLRVAAGSVLVALGRPMERLGFELGGILLLLVSMIVFAPRLGTHGLVLAVIESEAIVSACGWWAVRRRLNAH